MGFHEVVKILLENGADANFMTAENERAIDLVDQDDFPLISLLLKYMNATILNDDQNESFDEMDTIFLYKRLFLNILRSCDDTENVNHELEKMVDQKYFQSNILRKALAMAICDICVLKNELDKHELKKKLDILLKYIKNSIDCELNLIRAVYDFIKISEYSIDLFKKIIICFNDLKLISNSAYQMWRSKEKDLEKKKFGFSLKY
ncbi:eukaryotic translation initiation factor 4 gamma 3 [Brachionus plicatilis]|uniref:Eukaryotic translation initiation factor 4 gamma 3 n=1 Tax=Brachionus plicatilis TaxID=10195 RepID=A0A3M7PUY2_BRAPC|nr:eukaryotic translation initiation factor 4 gamma 3 [Brachionus plicatilis]